MGELLHLQMFSIGRGTSGGWETYMNKTVWVYNSNSSKWSPFIHWTISATRLYRKRSRFSWRNKITSDYALCVKIHYVQLEVDKLVFNGKESGTSTTDMWHVGIYLRENGEWRKKILFETGSVLLYSFQFPGTNISVDVIVSKNDTHRRFTISILEWRTFLRSN